MNRVFALCLAPTLLLADPDSRAEEERRGYATSTRDGIGKADDPALKSGP